MGLGGLNKSLPSICLTPYEKTDVPVIVSASLSLAHSLTLSSLSLCVCLSPSAKLSFRDHLSKGLLCKLSPVCPVYPTNRQDVPMQQETRMYAGMYVCMNVRMYVCMYVCVYIYIYMVTHPTPPTHPPTYPTHPQDPPPPLLLDMSIISGRTKYGPRLRTTCWTSSHCWHVRQVC